MLILPTFYILIKILFDAGSNQQEVELVTLIQDAVFLYPEKQEEFYFEEGNLETKAYGFNLSENDPINGNELHFTNQKPYVIYGYAGVPANKTLTIDAGARVHFHAESGIFVKKQGSINVNGSISTDLKKMENEVIFEGDRLEPRFAETPGQWGTIYLAEESTNNSFNHATIKNGSIGIFVDRQDATTTQIKNTKIYNFTNFGIIARKGKINGENIVVNKCGQSSLACILGGSYNFNACTFANFWNFGSRQTPAVYLDNTYKQNDVLFVSDLVSANFTNCIIYGTNTIEVGLKKDNGGAFNFDFSYSLIRFSDSNNQFTGTMYDFVKNPASKNNIVSNFTTQNDPKFKDALKNDLRILKNSSALSKGNTALLIPIDANGITRTSPPDLGAYQHLNE